MFFLWWELQRLFSYHLSNKQHSIVNCSHHVVHYIPRTYLSYNLKVVPFEHLHLFSSPPTPHLQQPSVCSLFQWAFFFYTPHMGEVIRHLLFYDIIIFFNVYLFILGEWDGRAEREGERESQAGSVLSVQSPTWGSVWQTMRSWSEPKSRVGRLTEWTTQAPLILFLSDKDMTVAQREKRKGKYLGSQLHFLNELI